MSSSGPRTTQQLKFLWSNMKRVAKKTVAAVNKRRYIDEECDEDVDVEQLIKKRREEKKHITKTGGGKYQPSELTEVDARLLAMIESQAKPLANIYDDDNIYHRDVILIPTHESISRTPSPTIELSLEPVAGPSHSQLQLPLEPSPTVPSPQRRARKKYIPPGRPKINTNKKTTAQLKKLYYLKKIQLANMEINFKKKIYNLEIKVKQKELAKIS
ncbi:uncharacterized protein LOC135135242 [Zophobas morio]|uniref:uncharacterized protein LOC135135242 n=1 Tax=Zophobas morio TaxID=2755281 RepID=UPI003083E3E7